MIDPIQLHEGVCKAFWESGCRKNAGGSHKCIVWNSWHRTNPARKCKCECGKNMGE